MTRSIALAKTPLHGMMAPTRPYGCLISAGMALEIFHATSARNAPRLGGYEAPVRLVPSLIHVYQHDLNFIATFEAN